VVFQRGDQLVDHVDWFGRNSIPWTSVADARLLFCHISPVQTAFKSSMARCNIQKTTFLTMCVSLVLNGYSLGITHAQLSYGIGQQMFYCRIPPCQNSLCRASFWSMSAGS